MVTFRNTRAKGIYTEQLALQFLIQQGLTLIEQNISCRYGEIDIIMRDAEEWVFIEVRYRNSQYFGGGLESVTRSKQRKIINTAEHYMQRHYKTHFESCRFDMIEISGEIDSPEFNWIQDAFQVN